MAVAPQNIMATLRGMPDAQLAKYAAMHKNDPFIFPLAFQESQTRKQVRNAQQAQGGMDQPKVVDQAVSEMMPQQVSQLPEDTGIAQLPAQNMQGMATGGIVAFEEGGEVPRFNGQYGSGVQEVPMSAFQRFKGMFSPFSDAQIREMEAQDYASQVDPGFFEKLTPTQRSMREKEAADARVGKGSTYTPGSADTLRKIQETALTDPKDYARVTAAGIKNIPNTTEKAAINPDTVGTTGSKKEGARKDTAGGPAASANKPVAGLDALATAYKPSSAADLGKSAKELAKETNAESEAAYKPYAEMLQKERADLDARKSDNKNMALLQAGLGIMSGTSRHAFENIGKGGMQGLASYQEAKRLDDASKKALMASEIAMMQAQRAERSGNHKDAVALIGQAEQSNQFGVNAGLKAQEIKQQGEYQRASIGVQREKNDMLTDAYGLKEKAAIAKITSKAGDMVKTDPLWSTYSPAVQQQKLMDQTRSLLLASPYASYASGIGLMSTPTNPGLVRQLKKTDEE